MKKVKAIYLMEPGEELAKDAVSYGATGLVFEMEDGSIITEHTTDSLQPYALQKKINGVAALIKAAHKQNGGTIDA